MSQAPLLCSWCRRNARRPAPQHSEPTIPWPFVGLCRPRHPAWPFRRRPGSSLLIVLKAGDSIDYLHSSHPQESRSQKDSEDQAESEPYVQTDQRHSRQQTRNPNLQAPHGRGPAVEALIKLCVNEGAYYLPVAIVNAGAQPRVRNNLVLRITLGMGEAIEDQRRFAVPRAHGLHVE